MSHFRAHFKRDLKISFISEKFGGELVDIRVSVMPIVSWEKIVMRILRQNADMLNLEKLDFLDVNLEKIKEPIQ